MSDQGPERVHTTDAVLRKAEDIVRNLAAQLAPTSDEGDECIYCIAVGDALDEPDRHAADCPWRQAKEWVAAQPAPRDGQSRG